MRLVEKLDANEFRKKRTKLQRSDRNKWDDGDDGKGLVPQMSLVDVDIGLKPYSNCQINNIYSIHVYIVSYLLIEMVHHVCWKHSTLCTTPLAI